MIVVQSPFLYKCTVVHFNFIALIDNYQLLNGGKNFLKIVNCNATFKAWMPDQYFMYHVSHYEKGLLTRAGFSITFFKSQKHLRHRHLIRLMSFSRLTYGKCMLFKKRVAVHFTEIKDMMAGVTAFTHYLSLAYLPDNAVQSHSMKSFSKRCFHEKVSFPFPSVWLNVLQLSPHDS